jgi:hypothetical protein
MGYLKHTLHLPLFLLCTSGLEVTKWRIQATLVEWMIAGLVISCFLQEKICKEDGTVMINPSMEIGVIILSILKCLFFWDGNCIYFFE